jgi:succinate-acetate transporter protein
MLVFGTNQSLVQNFGVLKFTGADLGYYLVMWTIFTIILFIISMKHHTVLALLFLTLTIGFIGLDIKELAESAAIETFAAYDLIVCAFLALYLMMVGVAGESGMKLPVGKPWIA